MIIVLAPCASLVCGSLMLPLHPLLVRPRPTACAIPPLPLSPGSLFRFCLEGLESLNSGYSCLDASRPWLCYWCANVPVHALQIPGSINSLGPRRHPRHQRFNARHHRLSALRNVSHASPLTLMWSFLSRTYLHPSSDLVPSLQQDSALSRHPRHAA